MTDVERTADAVLVTMGHPDWGERLYIQAPDEGLAIGWAHLRRSGTGQWFRRKPKAMGR